MKTHITRSCRTGLSAVILIIGLNAAVMAEDIESTTDVNNDDPVSAQVIEPITVVGHSDTDRDDLIPDSITNPYLIEASTRFGTEVFNAQDIETLNPSNIFDLMDKAAGINLTYQGRKYPYIVTQRGGGSFTYIIDGAVLPPSSNRILYKFPIESIEEMQVVRGSTSLTLGPSIPIGASNSGSGLNTGFIIIRTKQPKKTQAVLTASVEQGKGGHPVASSESLYAGTSYEGTSVMNGYIGALVAKMDRPSLDDWFDGQHSESAMANTGLTMGQFSINLTGYMDRGAFEMQRGVAEDGSLSDHKWYYDPLETNLVSADMRMKWTEDQVTLMNLFQVNYEQTEHNDYFSSSSTATKEYEEETRGVGLRHHARFDHTLIQIGGQISNSTGFGPNLSYGYNKYDTTVMGWSVSLEQKFLEGNLVFDGGYRQDTKYIKNSSAGKTTSAAVDEANNDVELAPADIFALGTHWQITNTYAFDGRYYHGEQGTVGDFDMRLTDDTEPHPERQDRTELSLSADYASFFKPAVTWFNIDARNAKTASSDTYELDGSTYYYYTESDELRNGLELMISGDIGKATSFKMSWTRMLTNETTSNGVTTDTNGITHPENLYALTLNHRWHAYRASLSIKKTDEWSTTQSAMRTSDTGGLGDYTRVDANIKRDITVKNTLLTITLYGRNLLDENYATRYVTGYYPDRGRVLGIQASWAF